MSEWITKADLIRLRQPYPSARNISEPLTADQVKARLRARGETICDWADTHGYPRDMVYRVLGGFHKAHRGRGHEIAVALGMKLDHKKLAS